MAGKGPKVQSPKANPRLKQNLVEEQIIRYTTDGTIDSGDTEEAYLFGGNSGDTYEVKSGECVELVAMGVYARDNLQSTAIKDEQNTEWNSFYTSNDYMGNSLSYHDGLVNFEERLKGWGYNEFNSKYVRDIVKGVLNGNRPRSDLRAANIAPTLKLSEGDNLKVFLTAKDTGSVDSEVPIVMKIRRYKNGYPVDYSNYHEYDGGLGSNKIYWEDWNTISSTTASQWEQIYKKQILKNEAYKFYTAGVLPSANLKEAKINIDDGRVEKDQYYVHPDYNQLPFTDQYEIDTSYDPTKTASVTSYTSIHDMHRFVPTIDIVKDNNEDLTVDVKDSGTPVATETPFRIAGIRHTLA